MATFLEDMEGQRVDAILTHPRHQEALAIIATMIRDLRACGDHRDYYDFQQALLNQVLDVEIHRAGCSRVVKRLQKGGTVPRDAPVPRTNGGLQDIGTWRLERDVSERVARQLRSVGDALAWKAFDYDRSFILALSRNEPPGPMATKSGLDTEREFVVNTWRYEGQFALLHDLTSCLRIGDVSVFTPDSVALHEVKTNDRRRNAAQEARIAAAAEALKSGTPLPRDGQTLVELDIPYTTHLNKLRDVLDLAHQRGMQSIKMPGGRAVTAASLFSAPTRWTQQGFGRTFSAAHSSVKRRAGISGESHITMNSLDLVGRSAVAPPWSIYPLTPEMCASLIADGVFFYVSMSGTGIVDALRAEGLAATWLQRLDGEPIDITQPILQVARLERLAPRLQRFTMNFSEMSRLLLELVDLATWARHVSILLSRADLSGRAPWPYFADEHTVWA